MTTQEERAEGSPFLSGSNIVSRYTRAQAIEDGELIDVTKAAQEAGFLYPVALSNEVFCGVVFAPPAARARGEDNEGRLWDVLWMAGQMVRSKKSELRNRPLDRLPFQVIATSAQGVHVTHELHIVVGPGDKGEPVLTIMFPHED